MILELLQKLLSDGLTVHIKLEADPALLCLLSQLGKLEGLSIPGMCPAEERELNRENSRLRDRRAEKILVSEIEEPINEELKEVEECNDAQCCTSEKDEFKYGFDEDNQFYFRQTKNGLNYDNEGKLIICPKCNSAKVVSKGKRQNTYDVCFLYLCKECFNHFTGMVIKKDNVIDPAKQWIKLTDNVKWQEQGKKLILNYSGSKVITSWEDIERISKLSWREQRQEVIKICGQTNSKQSAVRIFVTAYVEGKLEKPNTEDTDEIEEIIEPEESKPQNYNGEWNIVNKLIKWKMEGKTLVIVYRSNLLHTSWVEMEKVYYGSDKFKEEEMVRLTGTNSGKKTAFRQFLQLLEEGKITFPESEILDEQIPENRELNDEKVNEFITPREQKPENCEKNTENVTKTEETVIKPVENVQETGSVPMSAPINLPMDLTENIQEILKNSPWIKVPDDIRIQYKFNEKILLLCFKGVYVQSSWGQIIALSGLSSKRLIKAIEIIHTDFNKKYCLKLFVQAVQSKRISLPQSEDQILVLPKKEREPKQFSISQNKLDELTTKEKTAPKIITPTKMPRGGF